MARGRPDPVAKLDSMFARLSVAAASPAEADNTAAAPVEAAPAQAPGEERAVASEQLRRRYNAAREIPLAELDVDEVQVREKMKNVASLAQSMRRGQLHPVIVTLTPDGRRYHLEAGARRVVAAGMNGWTTIYAAITDEMTELERLLLRLEENTQRDQLTGEEKRRVYMEVRDKLGTGTQGAAEFLGINERSFRRVVHEVVEGKAKAATRLSTGQFLKGVDQVREAARRMPTAKRREVLNKLREAVRDLEEAEAEEAEAAIQARELAPPEKRRSKARNSGL